jgi:hypothetical protein
MDDRDGGTGTMSRDRKRVRDFWWAWLPALLAIAVLVALMAAPAPAGADRTTTSKRVQREIDIMERTLDDILVDSPYILVHSNSGVAKGVHVPEFGVVFTFDMNLVSSRYDGFNWFGSNIVDVDDDGDRIVIHKRPHRWDEDDKDNEKSSKDKRSWWEKRDADAKKCFERGKKELVEAVLDYGDMLTTLADDQWILVAADLRGNDYFTDEGLSQYTVKARMGDIRAYASGALGRDAAIARIIAEES